jgi:hypothetical protein
MVRINSENRDAGTEESASKNVRDLEKMQQDYEARQARSMRRLGSETVPNGDPPSLMLWGDE